MNNLMGLLSKLIIYLSKFYVYDSLDKIYHIIYKYSDLTDAELKNSIHEAVNGSLLIENKNNRKLNLFRSLIWKNQLDQKTLNYLGIGIETFTRVPADLKNTRLFPQQIQAAIALTQKCVIQMDTGEGKTYAILPAAFTFVCKFQRVFIVCANPYLAHRDANRTRAYWDFMEISVGLGLKRSSKENWYCQVIYTTMEDLIFEYQHNIISKNKPDLKLNINSVIIDEVDKVLIDDTNRQYSIIQGLKSEIFDWKNTFDFVDHLNEEDDISVDRITLTSSLTKNGLAKMTKWLKSNNFMLAQQYRRAVEIAFIAKRIAEKNKHYTIENDNYYSIDMVTGKINYNSFPSWIIALDYIAGKKFRNEKIDLISFDPYTLLRNIDHISGLSGTVKDDTIEYLMTYQLPVIIIEPRKKRFKGEEHDQIYSTKKESIDALVDTAIKQGIAAERPVFIGTQNIQDAELVYQAFLSKENLPEEVKFQVITGKNEFEIAQILNQSGNIGIVTIATQLAGRGVDIRLSDKAIQNGGFLLLGLERSRQIRFDRQLLGRVGRQGEPFNSIFFISLEDDLMEILNGSRIKNIWDMLGVEEGESVQHSFISKQITKSQKIVRENSFYQRRLNDLISESKANIIQRLVELSDRYQSGLCQENFFTEYYLNNIIQEFLETHVSQLTKSNQIIKQNESVLIIETVHSLISPDKVIIEPEEIEGRKSDLAFKIIKEKILKIINNSISNYLFIKNEKLQFIMDFNETYFQYNKLLRILNSLINTKEESYSTDDFDLFLEPELLKLPNLIFDEIKTEFISLASLEYSKNYNEELSTITQNCLKKMENTVIEIESDDELNILIEAKDNLQKGFNKFVKDNYSKATEATKLSNRSPADIVYWCIIEPWVSFLNIEQQRLHTSLAIQTSNNFEFSRVYSEKIVDEWEKLEKNHSSRILFHLMKSENSNHLDNLFFYKDNEVALESLPTPADKYARDWDKNFIPDKTFTYDPTINDLKKVENFINTMSHNITKGKYSVNSLRYILSEFVKESPIHTLRSPEKILEALKKFYEWETYTVGIATEYKKENHRWLYKFLLFLQKKGEISNLPNFRTKTKLAIKTLMISLRDAKAATQLGQFVFFVLLFCIASIFGTFGEKKELNSLLKHLDNMFAGGFISKGIISSPVFLSMLITNLIPRIKFEKYINLAIVFTLLIWILPWELDPINYKILFRNLVSMIIILWIGTLGRKVFEVTSRMYDISLIGIWLAYSILFVFLSNINNSISGYITFSIIMIVLSWYRYKFNFIEIPLASTFLSSTPTSMNTELVTSRKKLEGFTGALQHFYGLLGSGLVVLIMYYISIFFKFEIAKTVVFLSWTIIYISIVFLVNQNLIRSLFSVSRWINKLNEEGKAIVHIDSEGKISKTLEPKKFLDHGFKVTYIKSMILDLLILLTAFFLFETQSLDGTNIPMFLVFTFCSVFLFTLVSKIIRISYSLFFTRLPVSYQTVELKDIPESKGDNSNKTWLKFFVKEDSKVITYINIISALITIIGAIITMYNYFSN